MQLGNIDNPYCNYVNNTKFNTPFIFHFHVHTERGAGKWVNAGLSAWLFVYLTELPEAYMIQSYYFFCPIQI